MSEVAYDRSPVHATDVEVDDVYWDITAGLVTITGAPRHIPGGCVVDVRSSIGGGHELYWSAGVENLRRLKR